MIEQDIKTFNGHCYAFVNRDIVLRKDGKTINFDDIMTLKESVPCDTMFVEKEYGYCTIGIKGGKDNAMILPEEYTTRKIRLYNAEREEKEVIRVSRAKGVLEWLRTTKFCACCGAPLTLHPTLTAQKCPNCGKEFFPRIDPCIIVLVRKGDQMLLARHTQRNQDIYACIAGFMEAGETAEQTVAREVMEETGISVKNIEYFGSQSWPFPAQMMIGFTAEYADGEIKIQEDEIQHAAWFHEKECPATPQPGSIAYRLIHNIRA